jgi:hypothetical protein
VQAWFSPTIRCSNEAGSLTAYFIATALSMKVLTTKLP